MAIDMHHDEPDRHTSLSQQRGIGLLSSQAYIQIILLTIELPSGYLT